LFLFAFRGGNIHAVDDSEQTPLHAAACNGNASAVKCLLEEGADVELKDDDGAQPIHLASREGNSKYVIDNNRHGHFYLT
jgi:ankyrin repeat protein